MVRFGEPLALIGLVVVLGLLLLFRGRALGRALTTLLLILALAEPELSLRKRGELFFLLVDRSASVSDVVSSACREFFPALKGRRAEVGIIFFGKDPQLVRPPAPRLPEELPLISQGVDPEGTDIAAAVDLAASLVPEGKPAQLILFSDGRSTEGNPYAAVLRARLRGIKLSAVPLGRKDPLILRGIRGPDAMPPGVATFSAIASVGIALTAETLWMLNGKEVRREVLNLGPGEHRLSLEVELLEPGTYLVSLQLIAPEDPFPQNNRAETVVRVGEGARTLVVSQGDSTVEELLRDSGIPFGKVSFLNEFVLEGTDLLVLDNYPLGYISPLLLEHLRAFAEAGGGILVILGRTAVEGYLGQVEEILPVSFSAPEELREPSAALVFVLDKSSSMAGRAGTLRKIDILKEAVAAAAETVYDEDLLGALAFDRSVYWLVRPEPAAVARDKLYRVLKGLSPSGGTDLYPSTEAAVDALIGIDTRIRHIIIVSDGKTVREKDFSLLSRRIEEEGLGVTAIAIGPDPDLEILGQLARAGKGDLILVPELETLTQVLLWETERALRPRFLRGTFSVQLGPSPLAVEFPVPPALSGYTLTFPKPLAHVILRSEAGDPILAMWRLGLGWIGTLNVDLIGLWSRSWLEWNGFPDLFGRILKLVWPERGPMQLRWTREGDTLKLVAEVRKGSRWVNDLELVGELVGNGEERRFEFRQTAPGQYEATLPLPPAGAYSVAVHDAQGRYGGSFAIPIPYPPEYKHLGVDWEALKRLAKLGDGEILKDELLPPPADGGREWFPLRRVLLLLSGLAFLFDLAWRKLSP